MKTKGEVLITGLEQIREGLEMISQIGDRTDLIKTMIGSRTAAQRLRDVMESKGLIYTTVLGMVQARNSKLAGPTVAKVISDFLDILFDLSKPYQEEEQASEVKHDA